MTLVVPRETEREYFRKEGYDKKPGKGDLEENELNGRIPRAVYESGYIYTLNVLDRSTVQPRGS